MHVVCSTDSVYVMPTGVMIRSVSVNNAEFEVVFHVIIDESVDDQKRKLLSHCVINNGLHRIQFHLLSSNDFSSLPGLDGKVKDYITVAAYYRLLIPTVLDENIDRVLYLDGDIVCNGSLNKLCNMDISAVAIAAATDMSEKYQEYYRLGYSSSLGYFNSGVLLINIDYWRKNDVMQRCLDFLQSNPEKIKYHDQDVLNIVLCKEKTRLPMKYNVQNGYLYKNKELMFDKTGEEEELDDARTHPVLIHYTASRKPWYRDCHHPYRKLWYDYLAQTPWKNYCPVWRRGFRGFVGFLLRKTRMLPSTSFEPFLNL